MAKRSKTLTLDCTRECGCRQHSILILRVASLGNVRLLQHCGTKCANHVRIKDSIGRNALHVAASKGHVKLVNWLLNEKVYPNKVDSESKWTPLHRSVFYGQLGISALLSRNGGDLRLVDNDGCTPLQILNEDRQKFENSLDVTRRNVYTWGSNSNVTLGHDHSKNYPERLELPNNYHVTQVVLCKFHSVFLTATGQVLTCGHGLGGRLGHSTEQSVVVPSVVKALDRFVCVAVSAARNHTVILTKCGSVYSCGLNDAHQLGLGSNPTSAPHSTTHPKPIKALKHKHVIGIGTGRYHSAMCTETELYTVGKNLGQLGFEQSCETQTIPRAVSGVNLDNEDRITALSASDAATALLTKRGKMFVCTGYTVKSIRWGYMNLEKSGCLQFTVCASLSDLDHLRKVHTEPTKVMMLDASHDMWYWEPTVRGSTPSYLPGMARLKVSQFSLGRNLSLVTTSGEVCSGPASLSTKPLQLTRVPLIQNATAVFTDFKSNNFTYTQQVYGAVTLPSLSRSTLQSDLHSLLEEACLFGSISDLNIEAGGQSFPCHKFIIGSVSSEASSLVNKADNNRLSIQCSSPALFDAFLHYLYGSHIQILPQSTSHAPNSLACGSSSGFSEGSVDDITPDTSMNMSMDENDLTSLYDTFASDKQRKDIFEFEELQVLRPPSISALCGSTPKKKTRFLFNGVAARLSEGVTYKTLQPADIRTDLKALHFLAITFNVSSLQRSVEDLLSSQRVLNKPLVLERPLPSLSHTALPMHSDLQLLSEEGVALPCHRCVLVTRSDYFRSMLLMGWRESGDNVKSLSLPVNESVLRAVLEFMYTDQCPRITSSDSLEWVVNVLVVADQLLLTRLKDLCEFSLASALTLRNVSEVLELAQAYSASKLTKSCLQFISANAAALLEGRFLDSLDLSILEELSSTYREMAAFVTRRKMDFAEPGVSELPESYFNDDNEASQTHDATEVVSDHFLTSPVVPQDNPTPRSASSSSRKKRRRKTSQSKTTTDLQSPARSPSPVATPSDTPSTSCATPNISHDMSTESTPKSTGSWTQQVSRSSKKNGKVRTKLMNKFNSEDAPKVNGYHTKHIQDNTTSTAKTPWGQQPTSNGGSAGSLRDIMAREEQLSRNRQQIRQKSPPPVIMTVPIPRGRQESPVHSPVASSPSVNPWKVSDSASSPPVVSLRELMIEAEAVQKKQQTLRRSSSAENDKNSKHHHPVKVPHQQVSFASIIKSQEQERHNSLRPQKPLRVIQIEERAITELEGLYSARDNPDEYITIQTLRRHEIVRQVSHDSPWHR